MSVFISVWQYAHLHWQDNVIASGISFLFGYLVGLRKHLNKLHVHLDHQDKKVESVDRKVQEVHNHLNPSHSYTLGETSGNE